MPKSLRAQALAIADSFDDAPERIHEPKYTRVSRQKETLILKLSEAGKSQTEIAGIVGVSQPTVSRTLAEFVDTRIVAKALLNRHATALAERVIKEANVAESIDVLERIEVLAPKQANSAHGAAISIVIGMPGSPAGPRPILDLSPVSSNELTE